MSRKKKSEELVNWECETYMQLRKNCISMQEIAKHMTNLSGRNYTVGFLYTLVPKLMEKGFKKTQILFSPDKGNRKKGKGRQISVVKKTSPASENVVPVLEAIEPVAENVVPVLGTIEPVAETAVPALETVVPVLENINPVLDSIEPVLLVKTEFQQQQHHSLEIHNFDINKLDISDTKKLVITDDGDIDFDNAIETTNENNYEVKDISISTGSEDYSNATVDKFDSLAKKIEETFEEIDVMSKKVEETLKMAEESLTQIMSMAQEITKEENSYV